MRTSAKLCMGLAIIAACGVATASDVLQPLNPAKRVYAKRFAMAKKLPNGAIQYTTPWMNVVRNGGTPESSWRSAFDCFEGDENDPQYPPIGFQDCGNNGTLFGGTPGSRWWFGANYYGPKALNDMTVGQGYEGQGAGRISGAWSWSSTPQRAVLIITTYEDFGDCVLPAGTGPIGNSVILDFGSQTRTAGYFWFDEELVSPQGPFDIDLPVDGVGAYEYILASEVPQPMQPPVLATGAGVQTMFWGTDDDVPNPSGRVGTQGANGWADDTAPIGTYELPGDCGASVPPAGGCPTQLGTMIQFWVKGSGEPCACDCDTSTGPETCDIFDFLCFQNQYSQNDPRACDCDTSTGPFVCDIFDFLCFQNKYDEALNNGCP